MALAFLTGSGSASNAKLFEIRLDQNIIVLRGTEQEASSVLLRGTLVLCLSEPLRVGGIYMRLTGESRVSWSTNGSGSRGVKQEEEVLRHCWTFVNPPKGKMETLVAGNYEFPFEVIIPGNTPESIEGLPECWVIYRMKATIDRGRLQQNIHARKHVRIIRTLDPAALELAHSMSVENTWPEKVRYDINIPCKAVIFGTSINVNFELVPLLKGLRIGKISTDLFELQDFELDQISQINKYYRGQRLIAEDEWEMPDEWPAEEIDGLEGYRFVRSLKIPLNLRECVQDVEAKCIRIKHKLNFVVRLINPDSHVSELRATLPVMIFISPNLPLNEHNRVMNPSDLSVQIIQDLEQHAPPMYGEHQFDQLYSNVDPSGFVTPAGGASGINTPFHLHSRNASVEDISSMNTAAEAEFSANVLQNRLYNMQDHGSSRHAGDRSATVLPATISGEAADEESSARHNSVPHAESLSSSVGSANRQSPNDPLSRRTSDDDATPLGPRALRPEAQHIEINDMDEIFRLPSYGRAVRTPVRIPANEGPPTYQAAISSSIAPLAPLPSAPAQAHTAGPSSYFREARTSNRTRGIPASTR